MVVCIFALSVEGNTDHKATHHVTKHTDASNHGKAVEHHDAHKHASKSGKKSKHDHEKSSKGKSEVVSHKVSDEEHGGKKAKSHSAAGHSAAKKTAGHSDHAAKFAEGAKHKKNGYEKVFYPIIIIITI